MGCYHSYELSDTNAKLKLNDEHCTHLSFDMEANGAEGVCFHPLIGFANRCRNCGSNEISNLFDSISALKFAYLQFQKAHVPYEPKKIVVADELIMTHLDALCKAKGAFKHNCFSPVQCKERLLGELKSKLKARNFEVLCLQRRLRDLDSRNNMSTERELGRKEANTSSINTFEAAFSATYKSIHDFAKPLIALMKASGWDLDVAANSIAKAVVYSKISDKKYAFEAYIARRMFLKISHEPCDVEDVEKFDDPLDFLLMNPNSEFAKFCRSKYLLVVHPVMEASFFGNLDHKTLVQCGKHPRTLFYQIFAKLAKCVWILQGIATSTNPKAKPFVVRRGGKFSEIVMEYVKGDGDVLEGRCSDTVGFMVMLGFRLGKALIKSGLLFEKLTTELMFP